MASSSCPADSDLIAFHGGNIEPDVAERLAGHLEGCARCEAFLQSLDAGGGGDAVANLLRGGDEGGPAAAPAQAAGPSAAASASASTSIVVGRYKLVEPLGEGGMGSVFMAQQSEPVRRLVAVKLIRPGMDSRQILARFEAERQALALMDHPNIAKVLDAGTTATGQPYFAMELVKGTPITQYADDHRLSIRERLELFVPVCRAVQHAHQKGIIHRDIKPSNVLVARYDAQPVPKVIDFGVAKAIGQPLTDRTLVTNFGAVVGTPEYMAPEQAEVNQADVDTRCDVYALGVLLYQLLTGTTPLTRERMGQAALLEILRLVREEDPPRPSTRISSSAALPSLAADRRAEPAHLAASMRGELDWVAMRALEKDRDRRYDTPGALARDVERFLADEPVEAAPPTTRYRFRRFVRRHRTAFRLAGLVAVLLTGTAAISTWLAVRATMAERTATKARDRALAAEGEAIRAGEAVRQERDAKQAALQRAVVEERRARDELANRDSLVEFTKSVFAAGRPAGMLGGLGVDVKLRQALDVAVQRLGTSFEGKPLIEAQLRHDIGDTYYYLGEYQVSETQFRRAYELRLAARGAGDPDTVEAGYSLAVALLARSEFGRAVPLLEASLRSREFTFGRDHPRTMSALASLGRATFELGRREEGVAMAERALRACRAAGRIDDEDNLNHVMQLAGMYQKVDRLDESLHLLEEFVPVSHATLGARQPTTLTLDYQLATAYIRLNRHADAIPLLRTIIADARMTLGDSNFRTIVWTDELSKAYQESGRADEAIKLAENNLAAIRAKEGPDTFGALTLLINLAFYNERAGRYDEAIRLMQEGVDRQRAKLGADNIETVATVGFAARAALLANRLDLARPWAVEVLDRVGDRPADDALRVAERLLLIGVAFLERGLADEAEPFLRAALAIRERHRPGGWLAANAKSTLGDALAARPDVSRAEAEALLRSGYDGLRAHAAEIPPRGRTNLGLALDRLIRLVGPSAPPGELAGWKDERGRLPAETRPPLLR